MKASSSTSSRTTTLSVDSFMMPLFIRLSSGSERSFTRLAWISKRFLSAPTRNVKMPESRMLGILCQLSACILSNMVEELVTHDLKSAIIVVRWCSQLGDGCLILAIGDEKGSLVKSFVWLISEIGVEMVAGRS